MKQYTLDELVSIIESSPVMSPKFCLFGIRNKFNSKIITIGELGKTLICGWTESIKGANVWDSECVAKEVFEMLSKDKEFAKKQFRGPTYRGRNKRIYGRQDMKVVCTKPGHYCFLTKNHFYGFPPKEAAYNTTDLFRPAALNLNQGDVYWAVPLADAIQFDGKEHHCKINRDELGLSSIAIDYYISEEDYKDIFRPFIYPHLQTKLFNEIEEMNKWLVDISPNRIRDIKPSPNPDALCWLVLYEERGDE